MKLIKEEQFITCVFDNDELNATELHWTPEEIAKAEPMIEVGPFEAKLKCTDDVQPSQNADVSVFPFCCGGKLLFTKNGKSYYGTAQFVGDQCIILTAAHCVRSSDDGEWACNFAFYQGYKEGKAAQVITIKSVSIRTEWTPPVKYAYDYAFLIAESDSKSGYLECETMLQTDKVTAFGYPATIEGGNIMQKVTSEVVNNTGIDGVVAMLNTPFTGGSSGGAWLKQSANDYKVVGLNSFLISGCNNVMFGPFMDDKFNMLLNYVKNEKEGKFYGN